MNMHDALNTILAVSVTSASFIYSLEFYQNYLHYRFFLGISDKTRYQIRKGGKKRWFEIADYPQSDAVEASPITQTPCLWWRCQVLGTWAHANDKSFGVDERVLADFSGGGRPFKMKVDQNLINIDPVKAELLPKQSYFWSSAVKSEYPEKVRSFVESTLKRDDSFVALREFWSRVNLTEWSMGSASAAIEVRFIEDILPLDEPIYVLGPCIRDKITGKHCVIAAGGKESALHTLRDRARVNLSFFCLGLVSTVLVIAFFLYGFALYGRG